MKPLYALFYAVIAWILSSATVLAQEATMQQQQQHSSSSSVIGGTLLQAPSTTQAPAPESSTLSTSYVSSAVDSGAAAASSSFFAPLPTQTSDQADSQAGAAGASDGAFQLGKGGLIAICVVIGGVVIFGIVSTALFITAKKRHWEVRKSIARASRRFTGRPMPPAEQPKRQAMMHGPVSSNAPPSYRKSQREVERATKSRAAETIQTSQR